MVLVPELGRKISKGIQDLVFYTSFNSLWHCVFQLMAYFLAGREIRRNNCDLMWIKTRTRTISICFWFFAYN